MSGSAKANVKKHSTITPDHPEIWSIQNTDHVKNVQLTTTHYLMQCPCGWRGWVVKELITTESILRA